MSKNEIDLFLLNQFPVKKAIFLIKFGSWLHKGDSNRFALVLNNQIIGYYGIIPTIISNKGKLERAIWWNDLIISKEFRGYGYQNIIDDNIRNRPEIKLGFPNKFASKIHKKHGWVIKDSLKVMIFPISPSLISKKFSRNKFFSHFISFICKPFLKNALEYRPRWSSRDLKPKLEYYKNIFYLNRGNCCTTNRDMNYFKDKYFDSPFFDDYLFYHCKKNERVNIYLICRKIITDKGSFLRIVDLYGSTWDFSAFIDLINLVIKDSINEDLTHITVLESNKKLQGLMFICGFIFFKKARFCYYMNSHADIKNLQKTRWVFADSDNDYF